MNKKFSTLVAALLLSGALGTVYATDVKSIDDLTIDPATHKLANIDDNELVLVGDIDLGDIPYLLIDQPNLVIDGQGRYKLTGRLAITGENVKVKGLTIENIVKENNGSYWKNAISVVADKVTITNNVINCSVDAESENSGLMANGISVFPVDGEVNYTITGNTIIKANAVADTDESSSAGIIISEGLTDFSVDSKGGVQITSAEITSGFDAASLANNTFNECAIDYARSSWEENSDETASAVQITPLKDNSNIDELVTYINGAAEGASIVFKGSAEDFKKAVANKAINNVNAAIQCTDGNILYGTAENPNNGKPATVADIKQPDASLFKTYALEDKVDENAYYMLVIKSNSQGTNLIVYINDEGKVVADQATKKLLKSKAVDKNALWKAKKETFDGKIFYTFTNQNGVLLKADDGIMGADGRFYSANNAEYNSGVVFNVSTTDYGKSLDASEKNYFALYEAAQNTLTVEQLNYFEQDGFSVTIKYQDADGKFTKEDIAGNEFVGHLTPMRWNAANEEFVEFTDATDGATEFYLKNADGEYIVVNAKDAGAIDTEDVLYFTTLTEEALVHHLARVYAGDDQEYFGEFQAKASASQTDPKKLTIIDEMNVNLADVDAASEKWASIGSWDVKGEPTLAASIETSLKPIQIALGSDKIVDKKAFLQKGKFYTIEGIASTSEDDYRVGKKLVAGAQSDENDYYWVKSYGNVLEGQFALTIASDKDGKEYYVFTNRENPDMLTYGLQLFELPNGGFSYGIPVGSLYTTDEDNEYRWGVLTMKIDTVAGHKASDGYQTLADVKNNKFYIGYASGVFGGNAWLVENHEGDENHVIGLDINQEDALIFTAKEYAAARQLKVEDKKSHKYYYAPSDSIYVISELGYFDGDDYKTTLDTLKLVSYSFVNQYTEPLIFSKNGENRYESKVYDYYKYNDKTGKYDIGVRYKNVEEAQKDAQHFALRIDGTKLNLRPVNPTVYSEDGNNVEVIEDSWSNIAWTETEYKNLGDDETKPDAYLYQGLNGNNKVYSGDAGEEGMLSNTNYLDREENDLFVVEPTEKPMYRTVINPLDTISIFRDDNSQSVLFEHNTFLGMENLSQYPEIAKAMIADTAYVRNNTYRPQYMLVVGADITPAGKWCPIHGDDPTCPDAHKVETSGWVEGRYLVNLVDTAIAWDAANKHKDNNPYINSEKYYRLGFVQAKHINDSLVIASTNDTLYVGSEDYNQAKFAFRYVDQEAGSFVIETANYNRLPGVEEAEINEDAPLGYLKWMNGVVVVVDDINNADVYNMNENETDTPTANEDIAVEEGVQVIAGNGAVTIQGAAGKTVVITNILGKAVANTTLTSDNQTINVPAGIVVVTVDGEAVKAIVK